MFRTGSNTWHQHDVWPPAPVKPRSYYFREGGRLSSEPPVAAATSEFDEYLSDPDRPVPFIDKVAIGMDPLYMVADQRFAARRPDVLVYESPVLEAAVTVAGPLEAELFVATSGTDSDWIVKLIDVYPDRAADPEPNPTGVHMGGYQQLVRGEVMRGKFRNSFERPDPFIPNQPTRVSFTLPDVYHTFLPNHRMMVQVQSTWFPLVDRNPQTFVDINTAKEADFRRATQRVYRNKGQASRITIQRLDPSVAGERTQN